MFIIVTNDARATMSFGEILSCNTIKDLEDPDFAPSLSPDFTGFFEVGIQKIPAPGFRSPSWGMDRRFRSLRIPIGNELIGHNRSLILTTAENLTILITSKGR
ncbi:MAG TPA: hypothetical protein DCZ04_02140 [Syntrophorhabdus aromaticivorans]|nr:hypothetical protein [Syntrophorhabdus aromaticivorans]